MKKPTLPATRREPVRETLHGRPNVDPYRWLEDQGDPRVAAWVAEQNAYTAAMLGDRPERAGLGARLAETLAIGVVQAPEERGGRFFYTRREGVQNQPLLYVREGLEGPERVLLDPNTASAGGTVALDWWYPSNDGRLLAYGYSDHGDEKSTLYVMHVESGELMPDQIPHTRYCSLAWEPGSEGFYYTRYPAPGSVPRGEEDYHTHVFYHALGANPAEDHKMFGEGRDMTEIPLVHLSPDGRWLIAFSYHGWTNNEIHVLDLLSTEPTFQPLITGLDALFEGEVLDDTLYLKTNLDASRGRILAIDLLRPERGNWREVVAERPDVTIEGMTLAGGPNGATLALHEMKDVASQVGLYTLGGEPLPSPPLPPLGTLTALSGEWDSNNLFIGFESYTTPPTVYRYDLASRELSTWAAIDAPVDLSGIEVERVWYASKDGTRVPLFIIGRKGLPRNGDNPAVLNGYGGFNVSRGPAFTRSIIPWLERGGIFAVANLRGGSEYGEEWHRAGMLGNKQNVFDDFIAAAEYLVKEGYTRPERLGISGGSNGGLLVGAAMIQRPDLFEAVVCAVPLLDMLRYQHFRIARLWVPEYGSAEDPEQISWLWAYSPYQNVKEDVDYPAVLFTTAESDSRVDPMHACKMAALMQSHKPRRPVLLRVEVEAGHGQGKPLTKLVAEQTDVWTFLAWRLGVT
jgi:prolyl oligopeptidase